MDARPASLLLLAVLCCHSAAAQKLVGCCLETSARECFPLQILASHHLQEAGKGCKISATVLVTKAGKMLCAPPPDKSPCVGNLIAYLDKKSKDGARSTRASAFGSA